MADLIGQVLGNYQIIEQIGMGGMATVYKAYQASIDRYVAIKVLPKLLAEDPTFIGRFEQEAHTIARLENKHILPIYDYGEQAGYTYLVMRYVGTGTLKDLTEQGALPLPDAVEYLTQIANALQYAHDHAVIHRDVKTSNVLIDENQQSYLTDFGIAKLAAGSAQFTGTGAIIGTPAYMSPEQCQGLPADARSDIYALGIVFYEILTGAVPFAAETPIAVVMMHVNEVLPSPRKLNADIPEPVEKVIFRALAKDPTDRYQTAEDFSQDLRTAFKSFTSKPTLEFPVPTSPTQADTPAISSPDTLDSVSTTPLAVAPQRSRWLLIAGLAALAVALVILGLWAASRTDEKREDVTVNDTITEATLPPTDEPNEPDELATGWTVFTSTHGEDVGDRQLIPTEHGLWMSSQGGLVHWTFDGAYTKYTSADGLTFHDIGAMAVDQDENLWLSGANGDQGVMRFEIEPDGTISNIRFFNETNSDLGSNYIWAFLPEPDGTLLAGSYGTYLEAWDGTQWSQPEISFDETLGTIGDTVYLLHRTQDGTLWAGGEGGLVRTTDKGWERVTLPEDLLALEQDNYYVMSLYEDPLDHALWITIGTDPDWIFHTWRLVPPADTTAEWTWQATEEWVPGQLHSFLRSTDNALWLVDYDSVLRVDAATGERTLFTNAQGIRGEQFLQIAEDASGTIWLATDTALAKYNGRRWVSFTIENEPPEQDIVAMDEAEDGTLWFAASYGWISTYQDGTWEAIEYIEAEMRDIVVQGNGVWVATSEGLMRWEEDRTRFFTTEDGLTDSFIVSLAVDPNHPARLWVGTQNGLNVINTVNKTIKVWDHNDETPGPVISTLYFDTQGVLWIGTGYSANQGESGQVALVRIQDGRPEVVAAKNVFASEEEEWVLAITDDKQGGVWVGTDEFLYHTTDGEEWQRYSESEGAPEWTSVIDILVDGDITWVATSYTGLYRYDELGWLRLGSENTGNSYMVDLYQTSDGAIWALGEKGIARLVGDPLSSE